MASESICYKYEFAECVLNNLTIFLNILNNQSQNHQLILNLFIYNFLGPFCQMNNYDNIDDDNDGSKKAWRSLNELNDPTLYSNGELNRNRLNDVQIYGYEKYNKNKKKIFNNEEEEKNELYYTPTDIDPNHDFGHESEHPYFRGIYKYIFCIIFLI
jgi:hypothetical protein